MKILHAEVRESEEAAETTRKIVWKPTTTRSNPEALGGMCDTAWITEAQFTDDN